MEEKNVLIVSLIIASMIIMMFAGTAHAWEYFDTGPPYMGGFTEHRDELVEFFGPRLDRIIIKTISSPTPSNSTFNATAYDEIDLTDSPVDLAYLMNWTNPSPMNPNKVAVSLTGPQFDMYTVDMRLDNRILLDDGSTNWAYYYHTTVGGPDILEPLGYNPMSDVWLRRAIATTVDKDMMVKVIAGGPPYIIAGMYTPLSAAYGSCVHPQITPIDALANYTYLTSTGFGTANVAWGNAMLDANGYVYDAVAGHRKLNGRDFYIDFYFRTDNTYRSGLANVVMAPLLTAAPPNGLGLAVNMLGVTSAGGRAYVMDSKRGHIYTGGWGLTQDPDHLWYLFGIGGYWHPGIPPNYMYYPGDGNQFTVPPSTTLVVTNAQLNAWGYPSGPGMGAGVGPDLDFSDTKVWTAGQKVWENPGNYWAWEMMIAPNQTRALYCAYKAQEWIAFWVCGDPVYTNNGYAAFHRTYVGKDEGGVYFGEPWKGVVNKRGFGVWNTFSAYNMHPANVNWGLGSPTTNITMRWGFQQPVYSYNPIYSEWAWDWYVMNNCYDSMIRVHPYTLADVGNLALRWDLGTWDGSELGLGTCSKVTFYMRHDLLWSDGVQVTSDDVYFTWGGPKVPGSLSNMLASKGLPPAYWSPNVADILSIATPDPWTVVVYLDVQSHFSLHSMSGWNIILPRHVWLPIISAGPSVTNPFNVPSVCSGGWLIESTGDPTLRNDTTTLLKNPLHNMQSGGNPMPLTIDTVQTSNATSPTIGAPGEIGNTHWIWPRAKSPQNAVTVSVSVTIDSSYYYETGPYQTEIGNYTLLGGVKNITLWKWTRVSPFIPSDFTKYVKIADIATNRPWASGRAVNSPLHDVETFSLSALTAGYYFLKVEVLINSLNTSTDGGLTWTTIPEVNNPFDGMVKTYYESCIVTARYDILGTFWKLKPPTYQWAPDLSVDGSDLIVGARAFGSYPGNARWVPDMDITGDFCVDGSDLIQIAKNFGWNA